MDLTTNRCERGVIGFVKRARIVETIVLIGQLAIKAAAKDIC